jgi:hypothetical protein
MYHIYVHIHTHTHTYMYVYRQDAAVRECFIETEFVHDDTLASGGIYIVRIDCVFI